MNNKYDFYDAVLIKPISGYLDMSDLDTRELDFQTLVGKKGVILGMVEDNNEWFYDVTLIDSGEIFTFRESDLEFKGEKKERSDFYTVDTVKVSVDPKTGEGTLFEKDD